MAWVENFQHFFKESAPTEQALVSGDLKLKGDLRFNGAGSVTGNIEGSLASRFHVTLDAAARITGSCTAENVHVSGQVDGDLSSREHIRLNPQSKVRGHLEGATLEITPRADFEGSLEIGTSESG